MSLPEWREEPIAKKHDRASFDCGEPALNDFLRWHARQSHDRGAAKRTLHRGLVRLDPARGDLLDDT